LPVLTSSLQIISACFLVVILFTAHKLAEKLFKSLLNALHAFQKNEDKDKAEEGIEIKITGVKNS
jgi:Sec-independent protein translocase protein TatA